MLCLTISGESLVVSAPGVSCASTDYVVLTSGEAASMLSSPFNLSLAEGGQVAGAVMTVWVVGWAIRTMIRLIRDSHVSAVDNGD